MSTRRDSYDDEEILTTSTAEALAAGAALAKPFELGAVGLAGQYQIEGVIVPEHYTLASLERFNARPSSKRSTLSFCDVVSFARYVAAHKAAGTSIFWTRAKALAGSPDTVVAVLDHHVPNLVDAPPLKPIAATEPASEPTTETMVEGVSLEPYIAGAAGWSHHVANLAFARSTEWRDWAAINGKGMTQTVFAEFLEDHLPDIADPPGATLLELAKRFGVTRAVTFESGLDLQNGNVQLTYAEADAPKGTIVIPPMFTLGLAPFEGDKRYRMAAKLRYRVDGGRLTLTVKLVRPDEVTDQAIADRLAEIEKLTGITPYNGLHNGPTQAL